MITILAIITLLVLAYLFRNDTSDGGPVALGG
jgi:hypothetical protein